MKKTIKGQSDLPDAASMHEMCRPEVDAARGNVPELQAENMVNSLKRIAEIADVLWRRTAKEAKQHLPPRNRCRPVLKGAPFVICSSCCKLVQVPADFGVSNNRVRKLRCGSCLVVLSYSYRYPARKKASQDSIDQVKTDTSKLQVEIPLLFEDLEEPGSPGDQFSGCSTDLRDEDSQGKQILPEGTQKGLAKNIAPSWWKDVLHSIIYQFEPDSRVDSTHSLGQKQWFVIRHISPEWAFSYEITKVIFTGDFLCDPNNFYWAVMFGDCEVPAEIVQAGVLLCHTPRHSSGKLTVYITSRNRKVCSEFKDFEIRVNPSTSSFTDLVPSFGPLKSSEELLLLARFARILLSENGSAKVSDGDHQSLQCLKLKMNENEELWERLIEELKEGCENPLSKVYQIMEELLKSDLEQWLSLKVKGYDGTACWLSKHEQGIIHLISALGYEWALSSVLSAGIGLNFRDSNGWTALHWAAYFGRERMVVALLAAGASATEVTDPTAQDQVGKTAAFLASEQGHTGLAGYLSGVPLNSYLASLTMEESNVGKESAEVEAETTAVESMSQWSAQLPGGTEDELSTKDSLAGVRITVQAAARIQNAFRAFSFRKRQQMTARLRDEYRAAQEYIDELVATASRLYHQTHASSGQIKMQVEEPHSTSYKDVTAWVAMGKQRQKGGLNHTCMQREVGHKLLGRDGIRQKIVEKVLLDRNCGSNCTVICINGGSGLGKTSLLRVLYNDQELMDAFDKRIWIQLSEKFDISMLLMKIIEFSMNEYFNIPNIDLLQELVMEEITNKKFLLFLDDADIEDQQFWNSILEVLNTGAKGSTIVMATRSSAVKDVATHSFFLTPLPEENNMMILQQYSGAGADIRSNPDLVMVAKRLIASFGSNPLNLKAIGGLQCHADTILFEKDRFEGSFMPLQLCHDVLPIHLKKCLAFCSLFPEGYTFQKHHTVLEWISHGCVRPAEGCELEDVGVEYFNELLCRSFFQYSPVHNDKDDMFVMHELMYKVVESVSRDKYFKSEDPMSSMPENILHMSLVSSQFRTIELMSKTQELKDLRTFLVVQPECEWQPYKISGPTLNLVGLDNFFLKFTSLETLNLSHSDTEELPGSIVGLRNLHYLSVSNTSIRTLPSELCSLSNLQTLEAKNCRFLSELPEDTKKLSKLRHLDLTKELGHVNLPHGIGLLTELRTLPVFHANGDPSGCSIGELRNLNSLNGCLWLSGLESVKTVSNAEEASLKGKHHLKDLTLQWHDDGINIVDEDEDAENVAEQVLESLQPHSNLQELAIRGYQGRSFPAWMQGSSTLPNLVSLTLDGCCNCTQFPAISQLPSLKFLSVRKMYDIQILINDKHCMTKFPSLELLNLWEMYGLEELFEASFGDCPRLRKVCISRCPDLKALPCTPSLMELVLHCGQQLPGIPELVSLVSLKIEGFHGIKSFSLPAAAALPALKKLEIRSCKELSLVHGLSALTNVRRLKIAACPKLVLPSAKNG